MKPRTRYKGEKYQHQQEQSVLLDGINKEWEQLEQE